MQRGVVINILCFEFPQNIAPIADQQSLTTLFCFEI